MPQLSFPSQNFLLFSDYKVSINLCRNSPGGTNAFSEFNSLFSTNCITKGRNVAHAHRTDKTPMRYDLSLVGFPGAFLSKTYINSRAPLPVIGFVTHSNLCCERTTSRTARCCWRIDFVESIARPERYNRVKTQRFQSYTVRPFSVAALGGGGGRVFGFDA